MARGVKFRGNAVSRENLETIPGMKAAIQKFMGFPEGMVLSSEALVSTWNVRPEGLRTGRLGPQPETLIAQAPPTSFGEARRLLEAEQRRAPEGPEEPVVSAELLSLDPSDPRTMIQLLLDQSLATLSGQLAENPELLNQEGMFEQFTNLALVEQGMATDPQMAAAAVQALGMGYIDLFTSGELDTPEKAEAAASAYASQLAPLVAFEQALVEEEVSPEDELTALYEQQVKEQAEFEQMGFYRAGIMDIVSLAPAEARLGLMAGMLENPEIAKMFFPKPPEQPKPWAPDRPTGGLPPESKFVIE